MRNWLCAILLLVPGIIGAQESDTTASSVLFSFINMQNGERYLGVVQDHTDEVLVLDEINLGRTEILRKNIKSWQDVFSRRDVMLTMINQTSYRGHFVDKAGWMCHFQTQDGKVMEVPLGFITAIEDLPEKENVAISNPNATRYFFAPSAIPLSKGSGYYQNAYLVSNSVNYGVSENFSVGGGVIIPLLFYVTPKVGFEVRKNLYLGAGFIAGTTIIPDAIVAGGIPFGLVTVGTEETNVTVAAGYGLLWNEGEFDQSEYPIGTLNGMMRISNRVSLISENWIIPFPQRQEYLIEDGYQDAMGNWVPPVIEERTELRTSTAFSLGARILIGKNTSVDFAPVYIGTTGSDGIVLPYLDFVYKF